VPPTAHSAFHYRRYKNDPGCLQEFALAVSLMRCGDDHPAKIHGGRTGFMCSSRFFLRLQPPAHLSCSSTSTHSCARPLRTSDQALLSQPFPQPSPSLHVILLISMPSLHDVPSPFSVPNSYSIPIAQRVRRNRQRFPSSLLIENASDPVLDPWTLFCPRHFRSSLATLRPSRQGTHSDGPRQVPVFKSLDVLDTFAQLFDVRFNLKCQPSDG